MKYLAKFTVMVTLSIPESQRAEARRVLNLHHIGREKMKRLDERISKEHEAAHWNMCRHLSVPIVLGLLPDGRFEIAEDDDGQGPDPPTRR